MPLQARPTPKSRACCVEGMKPCQLQNSQRTVPDRLTLPLPKIPGWQSSVLAQLGSPWRTSFKKEDTQRYCFHTRAYQLQSSTCEPCVHLQDKPLSQVTVYEKDTRVGGMTYTKWDTAPAVDHNVLTTAPEVSQGCCQLLLQINCLQNR